MKKLYLVYPKKLGTIAPEIYGHFSEHIGGVFYGGLWVGKDSAVPNINGFHKGIVEKLRAINPSVLRWPGGCFAETYDWHDGIGTDRPTRINWWHAWDGRYEPNEVGTHEFMDLCEAIGAKAYFAANITSVTPLDIRDWMDYCLSPEGTTTLAKERAANGHPAPFDIPFWGVGNECWGDGGKMTPEFYGDQYRRLNTVMYNVAPDAKLVTCGANADGYEWTERLMPAIEAQKEKTWGCSIHFYCGFGEALGFSDEQWTNLLKDAQRIEDMIVRHWGIIRGHRMENACRLVVDEWGCWHAGGSGPSKGANLFEQQSTMRDAMVSALTLNIFNRHCDKVAMANAAQLCNNLHTLFLCDGERFTVTPTYHIFDMFKGHQGAEAIETVVTENDDFAQSLSVSASVKDGKTLVTVGNLSPDHEATFLLSAVGEELPENATVTLLANEDLNAYNTFEQPDRVAPKTLSLDPRGPITIPAGGIAAISF